MKNIPFVNNPGNACALACYTMAAQYLLPDQHITFEQLAKVAGWKKGYVVWQFPVWHWLMEQGVRITDYDTIDYEAWASEGTAGLKKSIPEQEFNFYEENTYDLEAEGKLVGQMYEHPNFTYIKKVLTWPDVESEFARPGLCDITLNLQALNHEPGFNVHRVVLLDISGEQVIFHDPSAKGGPHRHEPLEHFKKAIFSLGSPELARYSLET